MSPERRKAVKQAWVVRVIPGQEKSGSIGPRASRMSTTQEVSKLTPTASPISGESPDCWKSRHKVLPVPTTSRSQPHSSSPVKADPGWGCPFPNRTQGPGQIRAPAAAGAGGWARQEAGPGRAGEPPKVLEEGEGIQKAGRGLHGATPVCRKRKIRQTRFSPQELCTPGSWGGGSSWHQTPKTPTHTPHLRA